MGVSGLQAFLEVYAPSAISRLYGISSYTEKTLVFDASEIIHRFCRGIAIGGEKVCKNEVSHIQAMLALVVSCFLSGITPIIVFDGRAPSIKKNVIKARNGKADIAREKLENGKVKDKTEQLRTKRKAFRITREIIEQSKNVLDLLDVVHIQSPEESDAQCAALTYMFPNGIYAVATEDGDIMPFGAHRVLRNFKRNNVISEITLSKILDELCITHDEFIDICILASSDYNERKVSVEKIYIVLRQIKANNIQINREKDYFVRFIESINENLISLTHPGQSYTNLDKKTWASRISLDKRFNNLIKIIQHAEDMGVQKEYSVAKYIKIKLYYSETARVIDPESMAYKIGQPRVLYPNVELIHGLLTDYGFPSRTIESHINSLYLSIDKWPQIRDPSKILIQKDYYDFNMDNPYEILGISKDATSDEIKKAYKRKAREYHPDKNNNSEEAQEMFKKITASYNILIDPNRREEFDKYGKKDLYKDDNIPQGFDLSDLFSNFDIFSGFDTGTRRSVVPPVIKEVKLPLEKICTGGRETVYFKRMRSCASCNGTGNKNKTDTNCSTCKGTGMIRQTQSFGPGRYMTTQSTCNKCMGTGILKSEIKAKDTCSKCKGKGDKEEEGFVDLTIHKGSCLGNEVVIEKKGNEDSKGNRGDVILIFSDQIHKEFKRDGLNLIYSLNITPCEALVGFRRVIRHPSGKDVILAISNPLELGLTFRVPGKGVPSSRENGDLIVIAKVKDKISESIAKDICKVFKVNYKKIDEREGSKVSSIFE